MFPFEVYSLGKHQDNSSPQIEWEMTTLKTVPVLRSPRHAKDTLVQRSALGATGDYMWG